MIKGFIKSNKGMTLVELIVAIGIFVAAIVPMLYAFVYSTGFNFKSQKAMQSTGIAQAVLENCKSLNFNYPDLKKILEVSTSDTILDGTAFTVTGGEGINGGYYWLYGVRATNNAESGSRRVYDVAIETLAIHDSNTDYSSIQSMGHTTYNFGGSLATILKNEDSMAQLAAINKIKALFIDSNISCSEPLPTPLPNGTLSAFFDEGDIDINRIVLDREIIINVSNPDTYNDPSGGSNKQSVQVVVNYYLGYDSGSDGVTDTDYFKIVHDDAVINGHPYDLVINKQLDQDYRYSTHTTPVYSVDFGNYYSFNEAASAVYFYYFPGFKSVNNATANYWDHFIINNNMTVKAKDHSNAATIDKLDIYLFKQYDRDLYNDSPVTYDEREEGYKCDITMSSTGHKTYLYHNLLWKVVEDVTHSPHIFKLVKRTSPNIVSTAGANCLDCTVADSAYTTYGDSYKKFNSTWTLPNDDGLSHVLSNYAMLPYHHIDHPDAANHVDELFTTRYRIIVRVYDHGDTAAGKELEVMTAEMLNW